MMFSLQNKVIIVTGAQGGNGTAISKGIEDFGGIVVRADLPDFDITLSHKQEELVQKALEHTGHIDGLVNCAGVTYGNDVFEYSNEDWEKTYLVNLKGPFLLSRNVAQYMKENGGSIINITSLNSELAFPNNPAYVAMKGGLKQLSKSLALDLGKFNIRVNNLGPGYIRTNMTKNGWKNNREAIEQRTILGRWGEPEDLVGTVIYLLSSASLYVTGQDFYVDGGYLAKGL